MTDSTPPLEVQRFGRSQTPESPRPVHFPQPSNIPVLHNQMDPVLNDTATFNIPSNQNLSPYSDPNQNVPEPSDAVQDFLRNAGSESFAQDPASFGLDSNQYAQEDTIGAGDISAQVPLPTPADTKSNPISTNESTSTEPELAENPQGTDAKIDAPVSNDGNKLTKQEEILSKSDPTTAEDQSSLIEALESSPGNRGVDYQSLLDVINQSASTAPAADALTAPTTAAASHSDQNPNSLPSVPGLPPKPPAQEFPADVANLQSHESSHVHPFSSASDAVKQEAPFQQPYPGLQEVGLPQIPALGVGVGAPLVLTVEQGAAPTANQASYLQVDSSQVPQTSTPGERKMSPRTQALYDSFLEDERRYVTEGIWDRFPMGSRLFVGNLPSEKVTKRDLFHIFHRHGRLAQISIKQAYGFVQFHEASDCYNALAAEQGVEIRGRKIHLEVSKPQKNTRGSQSGGKTAVRRRSRSPDRGNSRSSQDRFGSRPPFSDYRDEPGRRRDDHRPGRSPSPSRSYRSRDDYRTGNVRSPYSFRPHEHSPISPAYPAFPPQYPPAYDEDAALQLPRRDPRDVPDIQILVLDQTPSPFISEVEAIFRSKGLKASTIWLSPRLPLQAVVKRQIIEGVQAIVKLLQINSITKKIPLQVFDRSAGASNVNFNEYVDLSIPVAADIVMHARQKERGPMFQSPQAQYPPTPTFSTPTSYTQPPIPHQPPHHYQPQPPAQPQPQTQYPWPPQQAPSHPQFLQAQGSQAPNAAPPNLQQLLANLRQPHPTQQSPQSGHGGQQADLSGLLSNIAAQQQNNIHAYPQYSAQQSQGYSGPPATGQGYAPPAGTQQPNTNVQNIMEQLARYQR